MKKLAVAAIVVTAVSAFSGVAYAKQEHNISSGPVPASPSSQPAPAAPSQPEPTPPVETPVAPTPVEPVAPTPVAQPVDTPVDTQVSWGK